MKRILLPAALVLVLSGGLVFAQQAVERKDHHDPHKVAMKISKKLNLSADQTTKLEPILAARQHKIADLKANSALTPEARHQQMHAIQADTQQQLAGILTPDQLQQMKAMHHGHHGHNADQPAPPPAS